MIFSVSPGQAISGDIFVPGDKSISHRAIILASIADGVFELQGVSLGADVLMTIDAMRALGVSIVLDNSKQNVRVTGVGLHGLQSAKKPIDCGNSGTLMRLMTGLLAAQSFDSVLIGDDSLSKRPMARVAEPLRLMGARIELSKNNTAPIHIYGKSLTAIDYESTLPSAQVKSAILIAGLYAFGKTIVREKIQTRDHTEKLLTFFEKNTDLRIPGDISSAAFFIALTTICKYSQLVIRDVGVNVLRTGIIDILKLMGAAITVHNTRLFGNELVADIEIFYAPLHGITIPSQYVVSAIDEFPVIFIAAAMAQGKTLLRGARELRVKESDRIAVMVENLKKLGVIVEEYEDGLMIEGPTHFTEAILDANDDHRVAMALCIAGHLCEKKILIDRCDFVTTSFPNFVAIGNTLGMKIT